LSLRSRSVTELVTLTVSLIVVAMGATTSTTIVSYAAARAGADPTVHFKVPVDPTAGAMQLPAPLSMSVWVPSLEEFST